jgi:hypothetical protein
LKNRHWLTIWVEHDKISVIVRLGTVLCGLTLNIGSFGEVYLRLYLKAKVALKKLKDNEALWNFSENWNFSCIKNSL